MQAQDDWQQIFATDEVGQHSVLSLLVMQCHHHPVPIPVHGISITDLIPIDIALVLIEGEHARLKQGQLIEMMADQDVSDDSRFSLIALHIKSTRTSVRL